MNGRVKALLFSVVLASWAGVASAQPFAVPVGKWWERPRIQSRLGLRPDQVAKLEEAAYPQARAMIDLKASVEKATLDLQAAADAAPFDAERTRTAFAVLQQARQRLETQRFEMLLKVRGILDAEQWKRLQEIVRERRDEAAADAEATPGPLQKRLQQRRQN